MYDIEQYFRMAETVKLYQKGVPNEISVFEIAKMVQIAELIRAVRGK